MTNIIKNLWQGFVVGIMNSSEFVFASLNVAIKQFLLDKDWNSLAAHVNTALLSVKQNKVTFDFYTKAEIEKKISEGIALLPADYRRTQGY